MILRRLMEHVKHQNWLAVGLDFVIVVLGVFIGFQLTEWNAARAAARDEARALLRLQEESEEAVRYFQNFVAIFDKGNDKRRQAIAALTAGSEEGYDHETLLDGVASLGFYPAISPKRSVYDEVTTSGMFSKLSDEHVRESVAAYYAELSFIQGQLPFWRQRAGEYEESAGLAFRRRFQPNGEWDIQYSMDFEALAQNEKFLNDATSALRNQYVFQRYRRGVLEAAEEMCRELSRATEKECAPLAD